MHEIFKHAHFLDKNGKMKSLEALEREAIEYAIKHQNGNMSAAARSLGISRSFIYRKIEQYRLCGEKVA